MEPRFRRRADGSVNLTDTIEATKVKEANKAKPWMRPMSPDAVLDKAKTALVQQHGDLTNRKHLLGFFEIQFGLFRGQTFRWVAENALGYAAYLVAATKRDPTGGNRDSQEHAHNKGCFREYIELFPSGRIAIAMKEEQYHVHPQPSPTTQHSSTSQQAGTSQQAAPTQHSFTSSIRSLLARDVPNQKSFTNVVKRLVSPIKVKPCKQKCVYHSFLGLECIAVQYSLCFICLLF